MRLIVSYYNSRSNELLRPALRNNSQKIVMVIDDDRDILSTLTRGLKNEGFNVHGFFDPIAALDHVERGYTECSLAICDVSRPKMTGFQLARRIRELRADMPVIFMTAFEVNKKEFDPVFPSTEIDNVIRKPFAPSRLAEIIREAFQERIDPK